MKGLDVEYKYSIDKNIGLKKRDVYTIRLF